MLSYYYRENWGNPLLENLKLVIWKLPFLAFCAAILSNCDSTHICKHAKKKVHDDASPLCAYFLRIIKFVIVDSTVRIC